LKQIHEMLGVTMVCVTHDQSEALTMSDRVAVFDHGAVVQIGTPHDLYNEPATEFVASFIGENNALDGVVENVGAGQCLVALPGGLKATALSVGDIRPGAPVRLTIRPCLATQDEWTLRLRPPSMTGFITAITSVCLPVWRTARS
jgi:putative spermidine/putrescine transport system ATP-binding protein